MKKMSGIGAIKFVTLLSANGRKAIEISIESFEGETGKALLDLDDSKEMDIIIQMINDTFEKGIYGSNPFEQALIDQKLDYLVKMDNIYPKVTFAFSEAVCNLSSNILGIPLYQYLGGISGRGVPNPLFELPLYYLFSIEDNKTLFEKINIGQKIEKNLCSFEDGSANDLEKYIEHSLEVMEISKLRYHIFSLSDVIARNDIFLLQISLVSTVTEMICMIKNNKMSGKKVILQCEANETEDTFISDLAVGLNIQYVSFGKICGGTNIVKYNRLLSIANTVV